MVAKKKVIAVEPGSTLARLLEEETVDSIVLESAGERFLLVREDEDPFARYDPRRVAERLDRSFGSLTGLDVDAFLLELRHQWDQDSEGRPD